MQNYGGPGGRFAWEAAHVQEDAGGLLVDSN